MGDASTQPLLELSLGHKNANYMVEDPETDEEGVPLLRGSADSSICSEDSRCTWPWRWCCKPVAEFSSIDINFRGPTVATSPAGPFAPNVVRNQKYSVLSFVPLVLWEQFKYFFNLYFLVVALTQFYPPLQVGPLFTYVAPLVFVIAVTMLKEAVDDFKRFRRDNEANSQTYERISRDGSVEVVPSSAIQVGDVVVVHANQRVPADLILFRARTPPVADDRPSDSGNSGEVFIRTDQLDGETDWKLRKAISSLQRRPEAFLSSMTGRLSAELPRMEIYDFAGNFQLFDSDSLGSSVESLSLENTLWQNTVVASGIAVGCVVYTGDDTRATLNTTDKPTKVGLLDLEINYMSKVLFMMMVCISAVLLLAKGFSGVWHLYFFRFVLLLSSIIPISMRVNLDLGKIVYSVMIMADERIPGTIVRTSTIPEELGRITYLFSDKTGTLTQNVMIFQKLQMEPPLMFEAKTAEAKSSLADSLRLAFKAGPLPSAAPLSAPRGAGASSPPPGEGLEASLASAPLLCASDLQRLRSALTAMALCHNVTPVVEEDGTPSYQASSPDEIALVRFCEEVGLKLINRSSESIALRAPNGSTLSFDVLHVFPFTSESKRMGIIVRSADSGVVEFYMKGAESVMQRIVEPSEWLQEECDNLAREGLRTLVFGRRVLSLAEYEEFARKLAAASAVIQNRDAQVHAVLQTIEQDLELSGLTGVEDKLQDNVKDTLETLRQAGLRIWMLTGDKAETATCIGRSARLIRFGQAVFPILVRSKRDAARRLDLFGTKKDTAMVVDGPSLQLCLDNFERQFLELACDAPVVICCRCSPTQKAQIVKLIKQYTGKRTAAIGDGGNDVSMIQEAHVGLGIVGKEGRQASLAADFSLEQFSFIKRLLLWHGRNSYSRSARLSQFVIHRGLIIAVIQAVFSALFWFAAIPIFNGWLLVGYATYYTMMPVFSLVLDEDVPESLVDVYPELYRELQLGRLLTMKTFSIWVFKSVFQGAVIMLLGIALFEAAFVNIVGITFTALIFAELINVAFEIHKWHRFMLVSEVFSVAIYVGSMFLLPTYFDYNFVTSATFMWKVSVLTLVSCVPVFIGKYLKRKYRPSANLKVKGAE